MIGMQQQLRRIAEIGIGRPPFGIGVAVRADDRELGNLAIEAARDRPHVRVGGKQPVGVEAKLSDHEAIGV